MISKISKLLIASVLVALNISQSNCMESIKNKCINEITNINTNNNNVSFSDMLKIINDAELCKEQCDKQAHEYRAKIDSITYEAGFKQREINRLLESMKKNNDRSIYKIDIDKMLETNNIIQRNLQEIKDFDSKKKELEKLSDKLYEEKWYVLNEKREEQLQKFYDRLLGNDLNDFGKVLLQFSGQELSSIYNILNKNDVKKYICNNFFNNIQLYSRIRNLYELDNCSDDELYFYHNKSEDYIKEIHNIFKKEYNNIENIINNNKINNKIKNKKYINADDIVRNDIINIFIKYINDKKDKIKKEESEAIKICNEYGNCCKNERRKIKLIITEENNGKYTICITGINILSNESKNTKSNNKYDSSESDE